MKLSTVVFVVFTLLAEAMSKLETFNIGHDLLSLSLYVIDDLIFS